MVHIYIHTHIHTYIHAYICTETLLKATHKFSNVWMYCMSLEVLNLVKRLVENKDHTVVVIMIDLLFIARKQLSLLKIDTSEQNGTYIYTYAHTYIHTCIHMYRDFIESNT